MISETETPNTINSSNNTEIETHTQLVRKIENSKKIVTDNNANVNNVNNVYSIDETETPMNQSVNIVNSVSISETETQIIDFKKEVVAGKIESEKKTNERNISKEDKKTSDEGYITVKGKNKKSSGNQKRKNKKGNTPSDEEIIQKKKEKINDKEEEEDNKEANTTVDSEILVIDEDMEVDDRAEEIEVAQNSSADDKSREAESTGKNEDVKETKKEEETTKEKESSQTSSNSNTNTEKIMEPKEADEAKEEEYYIPAAAAAGETTTAVAEMESLHAAKEEKTNEREEFKRKKMIKFAEMIKHLDDEDDGLTEYPALKRFNDLEINPTQTQTPKKSYSDATSGQKTADNTFVSKSTLLADITNIKTDFKIESFAADFRRQYAKAWELIIGVQVKGKHTVELTFRKDTPRNIMAISGMDTHGLHIPIRPLNRGLTNVTIWNLEVDLPDEDVENFLKEYGTDITGYRHKAKLLGKEVYTGRRIYTMKMNDKYLPQYIKIRGCPGKTQYTGQEERAEKERQKIEKENLEKEEKEKAEQYKRDKARCEKMLKTFEMIKDDTQEVVYSVLHPIKGEKPKSREEYHMQTYHGAIREAHERGLLKVTQHDEEDEPERHTKSKRRGVDMITEKATWRDCVALSTNLLEHKLPKQRDLEVYDILRALGLRAQFGQFDDYNTLAVDPEIFSDNVLMHWASMDKGDTYEFLQETIEQIFWDVYITYPYDTYMNHS